MYIPTMILTIAFLLSTGYYKYVLYLLFILLTIGVAIKLYVTYKTVICSCRTSLDNRVVLITGGNAGIGFQTAKRLAKHGAHVVIASRNVDKSRAAAESIARDTGNHKIDVMHLDLSRLTAVKQFADEFNKTYDRLDVLINNAGLGCPDHKFTEDGIEMVMQVNHVGPSYLTHLLLDKLVASKPSRIIFVGSNMYMVNQFDPDDLVGKAPGRGFCKHFYYYNISKLCNILASKALAKRLPTGVTANTLHPGTTASEIWEALPNKYLRKLTYCLLRWFCKTEEECAQDSVHLVLSPSVASITGQYFEDCKEVTRLLPQVTDELADRVWNDTVKLFSAKPM